MSDEQHEVRCRGCGHLGWAADHRGGLCKDCQQFFRPLRPRPVIR